MVCDTETLREVDIRRWRIDGVPLKEQVLKFDSPKIVEHLARTLNLTAEKADELFTDVKKFVFVADITGFGRYLVPPPKIDLGWHEFILHTGEYAYFCDMIGGFVHHSPRSYTHPGDGEAMERACSDAKEVFGALSSNWDIPQAKAA